MPPVMKAVVSSGGDSITRSRSLFRMWCTHSTVAADSLAGSTVKTWSYLVLKYRASFARRPARASGTGDDSSPTLDTVLKSTSYDTSTPVPHGDRWSAHSDSTQVLVA